MGKYLIAVDVKLEGILTHTNDPDKSREENASVLVQRAVALYLYLHEQTDSSTKKVAVIDSNDANKVLTIIDTLP
jgi:hypothetical protein